MLSEGLDIPPPVLKENADEYFELLAKEEEADKWIEKYSIDTYPNIDNTNTVSYTHLTLPTIYSV